MASRQCGTAVYEPVSESERRAVRGKKFSIIKIHVGIMHSTVAARLKLTR